MSYKSGARDTDGDDEKETHQQKHQSESADEQTSESADEQTSESGIPDMSPPTPVTEKTQSDTTDDSHNNGSLKPPHQQHQTTEETNSSARERSQSDPSTSIEEAGHSTDSAQQDDSEKPYFHRRSNTRDERDVRQVFLRDRVIGDEEEVLDQLSKYPGEDPNLLDIREAAMIVGLQHPEKLVDQLQKDGLIIQYPE